MVRNPFHLVEFSPWPLVGSVGAFFLTVGFASSFHYFGVFCIFFGIFIIFLTILQWWRDIVREGSYQGHHTFQVSIGLRFGMLLFIVSEVLFFFAFFWSYFHRRLVPAIELGSCWPSIGIIFLNPFSVPLLNTAVLLSSGVRVTWAHHSFIEKNRLNVIYGLVITIFLGVYFTFLQVGEYYEACFRISDSVFGSVFFVATGFHGFHVLIGSTFLIICLLRVIFFHFSNGHHFGFEAAAWYWHFVDVVWLFLYLCIYWWGY